jgi:DNA-binding NtrC family response regulator
MEKLNILILDDEKRVREEIVEFLSGKDFKVFEAGLPSQAMRTLQNEAIDILILDIKLPEMDGLEVLKKVRRDYSNVEVIMISGHGDMKSVIEALRLGAVDFFQKPFRLIEINNAIVRTKRFIAIQQRVQSLEKNIRLLSREIEKEIGHKLIGVSEGIKTVIDLMLRLAQTDNTSVLITGESGTGKELVAKGIHILSKRKNQYFYSVNCSAVPESLFESEFFGHIKGAFTGANMDKAGWFETANNGTLFLDEISDMPQSQQAKLLRVLEEKKVSRVGSHKAKDVDVRVIAASNQDLESMATEKKFRLDLFHRLSTFIIEVPPLRDRKEDIPLLLENFIKEFAQKMGKNIKRTDKNVVAKLQQYSFPGNIRELRNLVERAVIVCDDEVITEAHFNMIGGKIEGIKAIEPEDGSQSMDLELTEIKLIKKALEEAGNNKSKAAQMLNITWQSLNRRLKKFGIDVEE